MLAWQRGMSTYFHGVLTLIPFLLLIVLRVALFLLGASIVISTFLSAIRTFVLPRSSPTMITRAVFIVVRWLFDQRIKNTNSYEKKDRAMELYAPMTLIALLVAWLLCIQFGHIGMLWAVNT